MPRHTLLLVVLLFFYAEATEARSGIRHRAPVATVNEAVDQTTQEQHYWVHAGRPTALARTALRILATARSHGLDDHSYRVNSLHRDYARLAQGDTGRWRDFESSLTNSLARFANDMRPADLSELSDRERMKSLATAIAAAARTGDLEQFFDRLVPRDPQYDALRKALRAYESQPRASSRILIGEGPTLSRGDVGPRVGRLRERLLGPGDPTGEADERNTFDVDLEQAVKAYQSANGLASDGIAGPSTVRQLDMSDDERIALIKLNLDRWRHLPVDLGRDHILVNIPEYRLRYFRERQQSLSMRVVVGSRSNPTPEFSDEIEYLVFNPYWYVPQSILRGELLPALQENSSYLSANRYELLADGRAIAPEEIDFSAFDFSEFPYRVRQTPGSHNALGAVKFLFPNTRNIYLHDSPAKNLYARPVRAFSHGCIRLEEPDLLAQALLEKDAGWTEAQVDETISGGARHQVNLDDSVPIHLAYFTVRVLDSGDVAFFDDVYDRDFTRLERYLLAATATADTEDAPGLADSDQT